MAVQDNSILRAAAHFTTVAGSEVVNVFHLVMDSVGDVSEANALADIRDYIEDAMSNLDALYSSSQSLDTVEAWVWNESLERWDSIGEVAGTWNGTQGTTEVCPSGVAPLTSAQTVDAHARGKKYLLPFIETYLGSGSWTAAAVTALLAYAADWVATYIGTHAEWAPGIWQESTGTFKQFNGTYSSTNVPAYQRRRKVGVGT